MIKVIAFDLVGVLVKEKNIELSEIESKLERLFGPNLNDDDYIKQANQIFDKSFDIEKITKNIIFKIYELKNLEILEKIKKQNNNIKIVIATNHLSYVREYIDRNFNMDYIDDIIISVEINKIKPNADFYEHILNKYKINSGELLFLDDNIENINGADKLGINTIRVEKHTDILKEISKIIH